MSRMTLRVYRVTAAGQRVELRPEAAVRHSSPWEIRNTLTWPPCACRRCHPTTAR
ncbi:hypothetical protein P3T37_003839 [Kitasatospora sp. MAA4]|uniref:hypothetical protein n=1 Tax=Kitasatospora sp. MAA4 TaxID=3035093 RepID=UPI0024748280|nr:hypothetical protein [Kitasatospora sp. MAA4]MDH6134436.1 hypothetical protein [Kitasatospora sp. MAA4]